MGNTVLSCCCYRQKVTSNLKRGQDLNKAIGFNLFSDSTDEEETKNDIEMAKKIQKVKQFVMEKEEPE